MSEEAAVSLAPSEEQMLTEIEDRLRRSDLKLAARLAIFRWTLNTSGPARECLSPGRPTRYGPPASRCSSSCYAPGPLQACLCPARCEAIHQPGG